MFTHVSEELPSSGQKNKPNVEGNGTDIGRQKSEVGALSEGREVR
jgi:hypothetical protein